MAITTQAGDGDPRAFLATVEDERRRADAEEVLELMARVSGHPPKLWGTSIIGFGDAVYQNSSGEYDWFLMGLSPRKASLTIYGVYDDDEPDDERFTRLGKHTIGKSCLYIKRLDDVDRGVLEELIQEAWNSKQGG